MAKNIETFVVLVDKWKSNQQNRVLAAGNQCPLILITHKLRELVRNKTSNK